METTTHSIQFFSPFTEQLKSSLLKNNRSSAKLNDSLRTKISKGTKMKPAELNDILAHCKKPEDMLEICFVMEQKADPEEAEKLWITGLEKFNGSPLYLENLGFHYYQRKQYHKSLNYLNKSHAIDKTFFSLCLSIAASYSVAQYHLVWDFFSMLTPEDQKRLDDNMLSKVATSALEQEKYTDASKLFHYLKEKNKVPSLPTLDKSLKGKFKSDSDMKKWIQKTDASMSSKKNRKELTFGDCITYACALMKTNRYEDALSSMLTIKEERF
ncbi:MAG: hypothetical protein ABUK01_08990 [Leptospirales bacterium]